MFFRFLFLGLLGFFFYGCSVLLPYEEEPLCKLGKEQGYCGSIYDVYEYTLDAKPAGRAPVKLVPGVPCSNCTLETYGKNRNADGFEENYSREFFGR